MVAVSYERCRLSIKGEAIKAINFSALDAGSPVVVIDHYFAFTKSNGNESKTGCGAN